MVQSPISSGLLSRMRLSVDWYDIRVNNAIRAQTVSSALQQCFDPALNPLVATDPAAAAATQFCQNVPRNQTGQLGNVFTTYVNNGRFHLQGIDAQLDWAADVGPGTLSVNLVANYLFDFESSALPTLPLVDYVGSFGPGGENGLNGGGAYEYRLFANVGQYLPIVSRHPWLRGASMRFEVGNIFNRLPRVHDTAGAVPLGYEPSMLDPLGRTLMLSFRKQFLPKSFYEQQLRKFQQSQQQ